VGITGSVPLSLAGGGFAITGSTISVPVTVGNSVSVAGGSIGITGSSALNTTIAGATVTQAVSGSLGRTWALSTGSDQAYVVIKDQTGVSASYMDTSYNALRVNVVTGNLTAGVTGSLTLTGSTIMSGSVGITGSTVFNAQLQITGSTIPLGVTGSFTFTGSAMGLQVQTGSGAWINVGYSGSDNAVPVNIISGTTSATSVGITGSVALTTTASVGITGSATLPVYQTSGVSVTGSIGLSVTGSTLSGVTATVPITGSLTTVTTVSNLTGGSVGITGSTSLTTTLAGTSVGLTGSNTLTTVSNLTGGSVGITGSSIPFSGVVSGSVGVTGSVGLTTIGVSGSCTLTITGSYSLSPNNAGILLFGSGSSQRVKVYSAGYTCNQNCFHCFYFGNTTTLTTNAFLFTSGSGTFRQTYIQPMMSTANQGLYIWSSGSETNMSVDAQYLLEA
jgi:hypothetical protein